MNDEVDEYKWFWGYEKDEYEVHGVDDENVGEWEQDWEMDEWMEWMIWDSSKE